MNTTRYIYKRLRITLLTTGLLVGTSALAACGASSATKAPAVTAGSSNGDGTAANTVTTVNNNGPVLPVTTNPITNSSTVKALTIDAVLVENNVDSAGKTTSDHLEIALSNTGSSELTQFEVYYTFTDPTTNITESYYTQLLGSFTIPAGTKRIIHFDNSGAVDHYPVNKFSLYYTDTNAMKVTVTVSATGAAMQTATIQKDAGGPETAD